MISSYLNMVTSQHRGRPKFMAWLSSHLQKVDDTSELLNAMNDMFDLDNAIGVQLDTIGAIVGLSRVLTFQPTGGISPILDDATYRVVLKSKIAKNVWKGSIPQIYQIWSDLFPTSQIKIKDNQDMSMTVTLVGDSNDIINQLIVNDYIIPKPMGVDINKTIEGTFELGDVDDVSDINTGLSDTSQITGGTLGGIL